MRPVLIAREQSRLFRYGAAILAAVVAIVLREWLTPWLDTKIPYATLFVAVMYSARFGGFGPASLSVALGMIWAALWFLPWSTAPWDDRLGLIIFMFLGLGIAHLGGQMREALLQASVRRDRLNATLHSIGDAVITTDTEGIVTAINPVAESLTGWTADQAVGKRLAEVFDIRSEATGEVAESPLEKVLKTGIVVGLANHTVLLARDGSSRPIDDNAAPIFDSHGHITGAVLVFRDVTERRIAELALAAQNARSVAILSSALDPIITINHEGKIVEFNSAAQRTFGYSYDDVVGQQMAELIVPPSLRPSHYEGLAYYLRTGEGPVLNRRIEVLAMRSDGTEFPIELAVTPIDVAGPPMFTAHLRDITPLKSVERRRVARLTINQVLATATDTALAVPAVLEAICQNLDWRMCALWVVDERTQQLRYFDAWHNLPPQCEDFIAVTRSMSFASGVGLPGRIWASAAPTWIEDVAKDNNFPRALVAERAGLGAAGGFPLLSEGRVIGVIEFFSDQVREPDAELLEMIATIGAQVGQFMERRRFEESLRGSERRFARFMNHLPGLAWIKDLEGRYVYANEAAQKAFRTKEEDLYGRTDTEIFPANTAAQFIQNDQLAVASKTGVQVIETLQNEDGTLHHSVVSKFPIMRSDGTPVFVGGMAIDISDRLRAEEALREADRRKDEFMAMLAHELRNPLAPIRNALELLSPETDPETAQWAKNVMQRQVQHIVRLVDDLLDVSRVMQGKIQLRTSAVELSSATNHAVEEAKSEIEALEHKLVVSLPEQPVWLHADPTRISQIISNLLTNAAKYTDKQGTIRLVAEVKEQEVIVRVEDSGIGIEPGMLQRIFDPFTQANRSLDRSLGGLGIGLALVRNLVEMHGGSVQAFSQGLGKGSEFVVRLPIIEGPKKTQTTPWKPTVVVVRRVLVVDDNHGAAITLARLLEKFWGHQVKVAHEGVEALALADEFEPEVVLLDIGLPGLSGYEVAEQIRTRPQLNKTLLVALTGYGQDEDRQRSREAGFDEHLVKPASVVSLQELFMHEKLNGA